MKLAKIYIVIVVVIVFLTVFGLLVKYHIRNVPIVLVGPIDPALDTVGPVQKGMNRKQLISILGSPLRPRDTGAKGDYFDPVTTDYFSGIYAEVGWTSDDRVAYVNFKLDMLARRYNADFRVLLQLPNRDPVILSRRLNWSSAQRLWKNEESAANLRITRGDHVIVIDYPEEKQVSLYFSVVDDRLHHIRYTFERLGDKLGD